jgi:hypothetical protein
MPAIIGKPAPAFKGQVILLLRVFSGAEQAGFLWTDQLHCKALTACQPLLPLTSRLVTQQLDPFTCFGIASAY